MKISCDIIRDMLPLYAEDMVSPATKEMVQEHLAQCESCTRELNTLRQPPVQAEAVEVSGLERIRRGIILRRSLAVLAAVVTVLALGLSYLIFMNSNVYMTAEEAIEDVYIREDGALVIDYSRAVVGQQGIFSPHGGKQLMCYTTRYDQYKAWKIDKLLTTMTQEEIEAYILEYEDQDVMTQALLDSFYGREVYYYFVDAKGQGYWNFQKEPDLAMLAEAYGMELPITRSEHTYDLVYLNPSHTVSKVLWDGNKEVSDPTQEWQGYSSSSPWSRTFYVSLVFALGLLAWYYLGSRKEWKFVLALALGSLAFAVVLASGGIFDFALEKNNYLWCRAIPMETVLVFLSALLWRRIHLLRQRDQGI